jgi:hypothetical protein
MGGYNSGRRGGMPTAEATGSYIIGITSFTRGGLRPEIFGNATVHFDDGNFPIEVMIDTRDVSNAYVQFTHRTRDSGREGNVTYRVDLVTTRPYYGGRRWWFVCPRTGQRAAKLCLPNGGWYFWSRRGYGLGYACQREARSDRLMRRARKLHRDLGGDGAAIGQMPPPKPKWMRYRTYERKVSAWRAADERADAAWAAGAWRLISRLDRRSK